MQIYANKAILWRLHGKPEIEECHKYTKRDDVEKENLFQTSRIIIIMDISSALSPVSPRSLQKPWTERGGSGERTTYEQYTHLHSYTINYRPTFWSKSKRFLNEDLWKQWLRQSGATHTSAPICKWTAHPEWCEWRWEPEQLHDSSATFTGRKAAMKMTTNSATMTRRSKQSQKSGERLLRRTATHRREQCFSSVKVQFLFHVVPFPLSQAVKPVPWHLEQHAELLVIQVNLQIKNTQEVKKNAFWLDKTGQNAQICQESRRGRTKCNDKFMSKHCITQRVFRNGYGGTAWTLEEKVLKN